MEGDTRLDRIYIFGNLKPFFVKHSPNTFSDYFSFEAKININEEIHKLIATQPKSNFKIKPKVIKMKTFIIKSRKNLNIGNKCVKNISLI